MSSDVFGTLEVSREKLSKDLGTDLLGKGSHNLSTCFMFRNSLPERSTVHSPDNWLALP